MRPCIGLTCGMYLHWPRESCGITRKLAHRSPDAADQVAVTSTRLAGTLPPLAWLGLRRLHRLRAIVFCHGRPVKSCVVYARGDYRSHCRSIRVRLEGRRSGSPASPAIDGGSSVPSGLRLTKCDSLVVFADVNRYGFSDPPESAACLGPTTSERAAALSSHYRCAAATRFILRSRNQLDDSTGSSTTARRCHHVSRETLETKGTPPARCSPGISSLTYGGTAEALQRHH